MEQQVEVVQPPRKKTGPPKGCKSPSTSAANRARKGKMTTPISKQNQIIAQFGAGDSNTKIAEDLCVSPHTVSKVLAQPEIAEFVARGRADVCARIPESVRVVDYRLKKNDGNVAMGILRGTGVLRQDAVNVNVMATNGNVIVGTWPEFAGALPGTVQGEAQSTRQGGQTIEAEAVEADKD